MVGGHARVFTPAATVQAEREFVALAAPYAPQAPLQRAVAVWFVFVLPIPPSKPLWWRRAAVQLSVFPRGPKDVDNLAKLALDAMTRSGQWWKDDAQIVMLSATKIYGDSPSTRVTVEEVADGSLPGYDLGRVIADSDIGGAVTEAPTLNALRRLHMALDLKT